MLIQPISDLHLDCLAEHHFETILKTTFHPDADLIILAGDSSEMAGVQQVIDLCSSTNKPILYIAGNHEYWGDVHCKDVVKALRKKLEHVHNVTVMEDQAIVIDDVLFIASTLWTNLYNPLKAEIVKRYMRDFVRSPGLTVDFTNQKHTNSVEFIRQSLQLEQWKDLKKIVITHHGPSFGAIDDFYKGDAGNAGYQSNLDYMLEASWAPDVWIHGHSHMAMDKVIGHTRVIRNPLGYMSYAEMNTGFDTTFLIDTNEISTEPKEDCIDESLHLY